MLTANEKQVINSEYGGTVARTTHFGQVKENGKADISLMAGQRAVYRFDPVSFVDYTILTGAFAGSGSENDTLIQVYADSGLKKLIASVYKGIHIKITKNGLPTY